MGFLRYLALQYTQGSCFSIKKRFIFNFFFIFLLFPFYPLYSEVPNQIKTMVQKMNALKNFKGKIEIVSDLSTLLGKVYYNQGNMNLSFSNGDVIAVNGKDMIAFDANTNVAGRQSVSQTKKSRGLSWLLQGISYERLAENHWQGRPSKKTFMKRELLDKKNRYHLKEIEIKITTDNLLKEIKIVKWRGIADTEQKMIVNITEIIPNINFSPFIFSYNTPAGSRTIENPLSRNIQIAKDKN